MHTAIQFKFKEEKEGRYEEVHRVGYSCLRAGRRYRPYGMKRPPALVMRRLVVDGRILQGANAVALVLWNIDLISSWLSSG